MPNKHIVCIYTNHAWLRSQQFLVHFKCTTPTPPPNLEVFLFSTSVHSSHASHLKLHEIHNSFQTALELAMFIAAPHIPHFMPLFCKGMGEAMKHVLSAIDFINHFILSQPCYWSNGFLVWFWQQWKWGKEIMTAAFKTALKTHLFKSYLCKLNLYSSTFFCNLLQ